MSDFGDDQVSIAMQFLVYSIANNSNSIFYCSSITTWSVLKQAM